MPILHELLAAGQRIPKDSDNSPEKKNKNSSAKKPLAYPHPVTTHGVPAATLSSGTQIG